MTATLGDLKTAYDTLSNKDEQAVDFLIMGPGCGSRDLSQSKANHLISIAEARKDCMATIGPHRADIVNIANSTTQTNNLLEYLVHLHHHHLQRLIVDTNICLIDSIMSLDLFQQMEILQDLWFELQSIIPMVLTRR